MREKHDLDDHNASTTSAATMSILGTIFGKIFPSFKTYFPQVAERICA